MSASIYEQKKNSLKMIYPVKKGRERYASNSPSRDNENLLVVVAFYTPISSFWERPYSHKGNKLAVVQVT